MYSTQVKKRQFFTGICFTVSMCLLGAKAIFAADANMISGTEQIDAWTLKCYEEQTEGQVKEERCNLIQQVNTEDGRRLAALAIGHFGSKGESAMVATLPLGVSLMVPASIRVDDKDSILLQFQTCGDEGCTAIGGIDDSILSQLKKGKNLEIAFVTGDLRKTLTVKMSLLGFTKGYKKIK